MKYPIKEIKISKIILALLVFLILSISYLSWIEFKQSQLTKNQKWWALYFENSKSPSLNFIIENKSNNADFNWKVLAGTEELTSGTTSIDNNQAEKIQIDDKIQIESPSRIIIEVNKEKERKNIYKNL